MMELHIVYQFWVVFHVFLKHTCMHVIHFVSQVKKRHLIADLHLLYKMIDSC